MKTSSRNRLAFAVALGAGLLVTVTVGAFASGGGSSAPPLAAPQSTSGEPGADAMSVFENPEAASASLTPAAERALQALTANDQAVDEDLLPGRADLGEAVVLLSGLGSAGRSMVGVPTEKRRVCDAVLDATGELVSGGCVESFTRDRPISPNIAFFRSNETAFVYGLASDAVIAVSVTADGIQHDAVLANNAFYCELPGDVTALGTTRVTAKLADGSEATLELSSPVIRG
jgi:hypothetical protein